MGLKLDERVLLSAIEKIVVQPVANFAARLRSCPIKIKNSNLIVPPFPIINYKNHIISI